MTTFGSAPEIIEGPYGGPVTLAEAKAHCRVDDSDSDDYITALISAAREHAEEFCQRSFVQRRYRLTLDRFPYYSEQALCLPMGPVQSVDHIKYYDTDSALVTWAASNYIVDTSRVPARITPIVDETWPSDVENRIAAVQVQYVAGYAADSGSPTDYAANVPKAVKQGILFHIGHMFENRQDAVVGRIVTPIPGSSRDLLYPYRVEAL